MGVFWSQDNALFWRNDGETLCIEPWGANSLRVRSVMMGNILEADWALLTPQFCPADILVEEERATIANGKIKAVLEPDGWNRRCKVSFFHADGRPLLRELGGGGALNRQWRHFQPLAGGQCRLTASFEADADEKLFGMGQYQQEIFNIKNCSFELAHRNSQASVPFVLSSAGYGFFWHNPAVGRATFARNRTDWVAESTAMLDYWITAGDTPAEIVQAYATATGKPPMMPEYGLGFWQCKLRYWNQQQVLDVAREYKRRGLPIDVLVVDFFHWPKMGDFRFDEEFFPDSEAMAKELKAMGITLMVSVWPQVDLESENYKEMRQKNLLIHSERGVGISMLFGGYSQFFDATNPEARAYVWQKCKQNYYDKGVGLFWLDEAEPEYNTYDFDNYRYHLGNVQSVGNIYPQLFSRTFYDGMAAEGQTDIVNLVRCAWAGSQRYGALVWSGDIHSDWEDFRKQICAGLHMAMSGIPWWTTDIGGFSMGKPEDPAFRELLVRWFQYGAFCPVMRLHGDRMPSTPLFHQDGRSYLFTGGDNEVWSFGEEAYGILRKYMELRERLRPTTRALMREAHETGAPVIRPLFYGFPDDKACWDVADEFLFGADLLVAPVTRPGLRSRGVYLPAGGRWTSLLDGKVYEGGQNIEADAPLQSMPVFACDGSHGDLIGSL